MTHKGTAEHVKNNYGYFVKIIYPVVALCLLVLPHYIQFIEKMSAGLAVISGIILSVIFGNPFIHETKKIASKLLTWCVVGLGCGMNLVTVAKVGLDGVAYTVFGLVTTVAIGILLGKWLKNLRDTSVLITLGTAICGGSAIAAIAPTIRAKNHEVSVALAIVFLLNALALFIFPPIGHFLNLTQQQFGLWSALAIHDTSSVVGASLQYGAEALNIGTTVKLARALWIVPVTFIIAFVYARYFHSKTSIEKTEKIKKPWFIFGFLAAASLVTWIPVLKGVGLVVRNIAEQGLVLTLFCIGSNLSRSAIKTVGIRPFIQGILLWVIMGIITLFAVYHNIISV